MRFPQDFEILVKILDLLSRPNSIASRLQLAKMTRQNDDKLNRLLQDAEAAFGKVLQFEGHRPTITGLGRKVHRHLGGLTALATGAEAPPAMLTIEADPWLEGLIALVVPEFLALWGSVIQLSLCPLTPSVRRNVSQGMSIGIGVTEADETIPANEILGPKRSWAVLVPSNHRLSGSGIAIATEQLGPDDRVVIPRSLASNPTIEKFLGSQLRTRVVECDACLQMIRAGGLGLLPDVFGDIDGIQKLAARGTAPVQLRLYLPRKTATISEPVQSLVEMLKALESPTVEAGSAETQRELQGDANGQAVGAVVSVSRERKRRHAQLVFRRTLPDEQTSLNGPPAGQVPIVKHL
jgi:hypothetical protein